jgi:acetolactate synthase-1/3 small subunit
VLRVPGSVRNAKPVRARDRLVAVKHTLSVLTENKPGVLSRVSGLFTRRGFNIDSLAVSPTEREEYSRMTITVDASRSPIEQVTKQLDKLVNVIKIRDLDPGNMVARELALVKVKADGKSRSEIIQLVEIFGAEISDVSAEAMTIQITGSAEQLVDFEELMRPFGLIELVKTGVVALGRGSTTT